MNKQVTVTKDKHTVKVDEDVAKILIDRDGYKKTTSSK